MEFQDAKKALKAVYGHSDSESGDNEYRNMLHVMFRGSWAITSRRVVKTLRREVAAVALVSKVAPHRKWMETLIGFDSSNCPKSMAGAGQLLLLVSPTISNVKLYHILIDGGAALNLISLVAFKKLQIPMGKLQPSRPFSELGLVSVTPYGCISLPVTFGTAENFRTESVLFDVQRHTGQTSSVPVHGGSSLRVPSVEDVIPQGRPQAPGPSSGSRSCRGARGSGPRTIELTPTWLGLSTPRATRRRPREDHPGRD
jgi:hypothetical protein